MTESGIELQMVITSRSLLSIGCIKGRRIGEEGIGIDTFVRSLSFIARVVRNTCAYIRMPTAFHLICTNQSPRLILVVEKFFIRVQRFLLPICLCRIILAFSVKHIDIAVVDEIA